MKRCKPNRRRAGMTLMELMATTTMMATIMASSVVLVRSSYNVWQAKEADLETAENAYATLRHIVRRVRQATAVTWITAPGNTVGVLVLQSDPGQYQVWYHTGVGKQVFYGDAPSYAYQPLAENIDELEFIAYEADGVTTTTTATDIHVIECIARVTMPAGGGQSKTVSCRAWLRSW